MKWSWLIGLVLLISCGTEYGPGNIPYRLDIFELEWRLAESAFNAGQAINEAVGEEIIIFDSVSENTIIVYDLDDPAIGLASWDEDWKHCHIKIDTTIAETPIINVRESVIIHEIIHCLGVLGHSDNPNDIMYPELTWSNLELTDRDIEAILYVIEHGPSDPYQPGGMSGE